MTEGAGPSKNITFIRNGRWTYFFHNLIFRSAFASSAVAIPKKGNVTDEQLNLI